MDTLSQALADDWPWMSHLDNALLLAGEVAERMRRPFTPPAREALAGLDPGEQVRRVAQALHAQGAAPPGYDAAALARQCGEVEERYRARAGWEPGPFSGTLTLFRASDVPARIAGFLAPYTDEERRTLAWCRYAAGPVRVIDVPGAHVTLGAEPHVRVLADRMRRALAEARPAAGEAAR
jgi:thioesterase domain-containing protein